MGAFVDARDLPAVGRSLDVFEKARSARMCGCAALFSHRLRYFYVNTTFFLPN